MLSFDEFHARVIELVTPIDPKAWLCNVLSPCGFGEFKHDHNHLTVAANGHRRTFIGSDEDVLHELEQWLQAPACDTPEFRAEVAQAMGVA